MPCCLGASWCGLCCALARRTPGDRLRGTRYPAGTAVGTLLTVVIGTALWAGFASWARGAWLGVKPFG